MDKKGILTKIKELFSTTEEVFAGDYKTQDGRIIRCYGEGLDVGEMVKEITADGEMDIEDGDYILEDGVTLTVASGKITSVGEMVGDVEEEMGDMLPEEEKDMMKDLETELMDGTKVRVLGGELVVGAKVEAEIDGKFVNAPEGEHNLADGRVIYVDADGLINEIQTPDTKKEDETGMEEVFSAISNLVDEVKSLRGELKTIKDENEELKTRVNKFAAEPSAEPLPTKVEFKSKSKSDILAFMSKR
jgi:molybdopterin converting factor small subunit